MKRKFSKELSDLYFSYICFNLYDEADKNTEFIITLINLFV